MNIWKDVDPKRVTPEKFLAYIEISKGMKNKYELDKETGMLFLDRILYTSTSLTTVSFPSSVLYTEKKCLISSCICNGSSLISL